MSYHEEVHPIAPVPRLGCGCMPAPVPMDQHDGLGVRCLKCGYGCVSRLHLVAVEPARRHVDDLADVKRRALALA